MSEPLIAPIFKDEHRSLLLSFQVATVHLDIMAKIVFGFPGSKRWTGNRNFS